MKVCRRPVFMITLLLSTPVCSQAWEAVRGSYSTTQHFAFYSDFATNLNDALIASGVARNFDRDELFLTGPEKSCFDELPPSLSTGWNLAVDYYAKIISPADWNERQQHLIRLQLAAVEKYPVDTAGLRFLATAAGFRSAAAPAYESCRWSAQDTRNRQWIDAVTSLLEVYEKTIAARLEQHYRKPWPEDQIRIDVVETVSWSGANSIFPNGIGGHVLASASFEGNEALEIVFHESSHGLMLRGDPLPSDLDAAAERLSTPIPDSLWHVILFFTTGETVRGIVEEASEVSYRPMIYAIYERSGWARYRDAIDRVWPDYLNGKLSGVDAATDLIRMINEL